MTNLDFTPNTFMAFIDVLGFKSLLKSKSAGELYSIISKIHLELSRQLEGLELKFRFFSDSIVIYAVVKKGIDLNRFIVSAGNAIAAIHLIGNVLARGAIAAGAHLFCEDRDIWISRVFVDAYNGEREAKTPRLILCASALEYIKNDTEFNFPGFFKEDLDGIFYLDYMQFIGGSYLVQPNTVALSMSTNCSANSDLYRSLARYKDLLINGIDLHKDEKNIRDKWIWCSNQLNRYVMKTNLDDKASLLIEII